jgi:hypothetical protein
VTHGIDFQRGQGLKGTQGVAKLHRQGPGGQGTQQAVDLIITIMRLINRLQPLEGLMEHHKTVQTIISTVSIFQSTRVRVQTLSKHKSPMGHGTFNQGDHPIN